MAAGAAGQYIVVLPELDLIVAHKTVPEDNREVSVDRFLTILDLLVTAKTGPVEHVAVRVPERVLQDDVGKYEMVPDVIMTITIDNGRLLA